MSDLRGASAVVAECEQCADDCWECRKFHGGFIGE